MSALEKVGALKTLAIKKNFPDAGVLLSSLTTNITTTYSAAAPYKQTDTTGIKELTVSVLDGTAIGTAGAKAGIRVCFDAPSDAVATAWFADTTADSSVLQYVFIPNNTTRTFVFSSAITRWDYVAMVDTCVVYQEKVL